MASTGPVCEINRYVCQRPGRKTLWFRRRVPLDLVEIIGCKEWRYGLKARHRDDAVNEAIPHLARTNEMIELARRSDWPQLTNDEAAQLAKTWAASFHNDKDEEENEAQDFDEPHFPSDALYIVSITEFLSRRTPAVRPGTSAFQRVLEYGRTLCFIGDENHVYQRGGLPISWLGLSRPRQNIDREPLVILHHDPEKEKDDLIGRWAYCRRKGDRAQYQMRKIVGRFVAVTGSTICTS